MEKNEKREIETLKQIEKGDAEKGQEEISERDGREVGGFALYDGLLLLDFGFVVAIDIIVNNLTIFIIILNSFN